MPLYEYFCSDCNSTFERLRPADQADAPIPCPECEQTSTNRILSLFATSVKTNGQSMSQAVAPSGGCCGGACGCHH